MSMNKTLHFFMFFCLSVVTVGGGVGGGVFGLKGPLVRLLHHFKNWIFPMANRLKTNTEININNLIPDLIKIHACVYRY